MNRINGKQSRAEKSRVIKTTIGFNEELKNYDRIYNHPSSTLGEYERASMSLLLRRALLLLTEHHKTLKSKAAISAERQALLNLSNTGSLYRGA
jgi:hypothetical protein